MLRAKADVIGRILATAIRERERAASPLTFGDMSRMLARMVAADPPELMAFLARVDAYVATAGVRPGPVSSRLFGASDRIEEIRRGGEVGVRRLQRASETLAALEAQLADARAAEACERPLRMGG